MGKGMCLGVDDERRNMGIRKGRKPSRVRPPQEQLKLRSVWLHLVCGSCWRPTGRCPGAEREV